MRTLAILVAGITLSACSGLMIGGGAGGSQVEKDQAAGSTTADAAMTAQVRQGLAAERMLGGLDIGVRTTGGMVTLSGTVPTYAARETAEKLAMATDGVKAVDNQIAVKQVN